MGAPNAFGPPMQHHMQVQPRHPTPDTRHPTATGTASVRHAAGVCGGGRGVGILALDVMAA
eukprot:3275729-Pleurochrysis_carterae.AAC.1